MFILLYRLNNGVGFDAYFGQKGGRNYITVHTVFIALHEIIDNFLCKFC